ncbi:biotin-dependent carboxyltransferase family protein [Natronospirillum operosum]|uniref:5-oxoprolinase subunit C family protein n=1 Tax=Natronospirillum operosum TaxID=2759953 RepID=UPI001F0D406A|nr:biotin-dependent carboxyltransferase family protein [Natronospirillum operosum]
MNNLRIITPGWFTIIQDRGRKGAQRAGLTEGGAADEHAYLWANKLLDNPMNAACLEVLMGNFEAVLSADALLSVTGADLEFSINGQPAENWSTHPVQAGDRIEFRRPLNGLRAYLGVAGGWLTPELFSSRSVVTREGLGGLDGGPLREHDELPFGPQQATFRRQLAPRYIPDYSSPLTLRLVPCYQHDLFSPQDRRRFSSEEYRISQRIDRMGYRLEGPVITPEVGGIISEGIALGAVQVPRDGQPIVLLRDRQTIGGYPKIGCVSSLGCSQLAQRGPGAPIQFEFVTLESVQAERLLFNRFFAASQWHSSGEELVWP